MHNETKRKNNPREWKVNTSKHKGWCILIWWFVTVKKQTEVRFKNKSDHQKTSHECYKETLQRSFPKNLSQNEWQSITRSLTIWVDLNSSSPVYRLLTSVTAATGLSHIMYNFPLDTAHEKWLMPFNPPRHSVSERYPTWASSITIPRINISFVLHWTEWSRGTLSHLDPLRPRGEINEVKRGALHQDQACRKSELLLTLQCTAMQKQDKLN